MLLVAYKYGARGSQETCCKLFQAAWSVATHHRLPAGALLSYGGSDPR